MGEERYTCKERYTRTLQPLMDDTLSSQPQLALPLLTKKCLCNTKQKKHQRNRSRDCQKETSGGRPEEKSAGTPGSVDAKEAAVHPFLPKNISRNGTKKHKQLQTQKEKRQDQSEDLLTCRQVLPRLKTRLYFRAPPHHDVLV